VTSPLDALPELTPVDFQAALEATRQLTGAEPHAVN
jgi:hypothetical protein